jgi:hypothetical protein
LKSLPILLLSSLLLSGCATLSKNECLTANWASIGYEDGLQGQARDRIGSHRRACADYGIDPNLEEYQLGYNQGLEIFCTPQNGFLKGKSGYTYTGICTGNLASGFLQGYENGREIYLATGEVNRLRGELHTLDNRISHLENEIYRKERLLFSNAVSKSERKHIYYEISDLKMERKDLLVERELLIDEKYDAEEDLEYLEGRYPRY